MMFSRLADPAFPALASLGPEDMTRITGAPDAKFLRLRYQPGARAILHVALGPEEGAPEGAIWFFAGDKARKLARGTSGANLDAATQAFFQAFPQDHRIPALATFVSGAMDLAPGLIGGRAAGPPVLIRYRPGLSATFRWTRSDGRVYFVKQTPDGNVRALALAAGQLADAVKGTRLAVVPVAGILPDLGVIAYEAATGQPLDAVLESGGEPGTIETLAQMTGALRVLWSQDIVPARLLDRSDHLRRAAQAARMIAFADADAGRQAADLLAALEAAPARLRLRPIHADMKLEHAFLSGPLTTLIDTESLSLGDPDYDLAKLEARLVMAEALGTLDPSRTAPAIAEVRRHAGSHYAWLLTCARLQCAKYFAQRLSAADVPLMRRMLVPC